MLGHLITAICFTTWACLIWAVLPRAFELHQRRARQAMKKPRQASFASLGLYWKPGILVTAATLMLAFLKLSSN
jgi:hypothetical protein